MSFFSVYDLTTPLDDVEDAAAAVGATIDDAFLHARNHSVTGAPFRLQGDKRSAGDLAPWRALVL